MRLWRFEFGMIKFHTEDVQSDWSYDKGLCGCHILSLGKLYLTWLGDECYIETLKGENDETRK